MTMETTGIRKASAAPISPSKWDDDGGTDQGAVSLQPKVRRVETRLTNALDLVLGF